MKDTKVKRHFVLQEFGDGSWSIREFKGGEIYPATYKDCAREMMARMLQLLDLGPVGPQTEAEKVCLGASE